jgi:hypothetical protein
MRAAHLRERRGSLDWSTSRYRRRLAFVAPNGERPMKTILSVVLIGALSFVMLPTSSAAPSPVDDEQRGCCSHHNGVCGCSGGRTTCCDGSTSPSCQCRAE